MGGGDAAAQTGAPALRMVATDLDGTLVRRDRSVSARTAAAVQRAAEAGVVVVLVTARPPWWVGDVVAGIRCHPVVVCSNGALVLDAERGAVVARRCIEPAVAADVVARLRQILDGAAFAVEYDFALGLEPHYRGTWPAPPGTPVGPAEELLTGPVAKLCLRHAEEGDHWDHVERVRVAVGDLVEVTSSSPDGLIELAAPGVSKAAALADLAAGHGIGPEHVLAFGDMPNDLPMLEWAGSSVAPANAHPDVLAVVDRVTADCDEDGVAVVLEELFAIRPGADRRRAPPA